MILCVGEAVIDLIQTDIAGTGQAFLPVPGGCAYNTSITIGRLGAPVSFLGRISKNFFGEMQANRLRENNVNDTLLIRCEQNPVLAFIKTEEGKDPQYAFYEEGTSDRSLSPEELPAQLPENTNCIVFGSISVVMEPIGSTIESFIFREARNTVTAFDPNIRPFVIKDRNAYLKRFEKLTSASTIVKISSEDYKYIDANSQPQEALENLIDMGTRLAIITLGPKGAQAMLRRNNGNVTKVNAPGIDVPHIADTVGAGDTFHGALLTWLEHRDKLSHNAIAGLDENDLFSALVFANKAAAFVCGRRGAQPPYMNDIE
ncbi:MAG: carbohydrate kinase [Spirochaetes bacterium]|nr:carbohydrate kinase [Spirochaetota bacterium]